MANVSLTGNFLATARCLIFQDGGGIVWAFNSNTNVLSAASSGGGVSGLANPTAAVGLTAVNGSLATAMRSDGAPALSQAITPTWTALHTFNSGLTVGAGAFTLNAHTLSLTANASVSGTNTGDQAIPVGANPSQGVGLSVVNGSAGTWMRSDGAPALSQAIVPTWTGLHTFASTSGTVFNAPAAGTATVVFTGAVTNGAFVFASAQTGAGAGTDVKITRASTTANAIEEGTNIELWDTGSTTVTTLQQAGGQTELWQYNGGWNQIWKILTTRGMVINAPASGQALAMTGTAAGTAVLSISTAAQSGAGTITIALTDYPGTNTGAKTPKYIPVLLDGAKHWIQALPD